MLSDLVLELLNPRSREAALNALARSRDVEELQSDLALMLWNATGVMSALLQVRQCLFFRSCRRQYKTLSLTHSLTHLHILCNYFFFVHVHVVSIIAAIYTHHTIQEIVSVYPLLSPSPTTAAAGAASSSPSSADHRPPQLTDDNSHRVCNTLSLLQVVASHPDTRTPFINGIVSWHENNNIPMIMMVVVTLYSHALPACTAHIPLFLYPFLNTTAKTRAFEYLRLTSLGVIGALVKSDDVEVIRFLLSTEIIPLCLRIMESGGELSKTVATFVIQKILMFDLGLGYICQTPDRFFAVSNVLGSMVAEDVSARLLKHIIRCFHRLADHPR